MQYDNTNSGVLFKNNKKDSDKHPDYTGKIDVNGKELQIAAWIRDSKNGTKFMSLKVSEPRDFDQRPANEQPAPQAPSGDAPINLDDIPF